MTTDTDEIDVDAIAEKAGKLISCSVKGCPRVFETRRGLSNHMKLHNSGKDTSPGISVVPGYRPPETIVRKDGKLECSECGRIESNVNSMASHKRKHFADAREEYVRSLEAAAREVGTLRRELRKLNQHREEETTHVEAEAEDVLTVDGALEFVRDQVYAADQEIISLTARLKELEGNAGTVIPASSPSIPQGDATATMELIRESFMKFYSGDHTMTRFVTEVEDALRLMYPDIAEE